MTMPGEHGEKAIIGYFLTSISFENIFGVEEDS